MKKVKLGDVCKIQSGGTPSRGNLNYWNNGNVPWVKISDIKEKYLSRTEEFITQEGLANSSAKIFPKETILYTIFATLGEVSILEIEATTNQAIAGLQIIDENICKDYLYYYLISLKPFVNEVGRGVAQNNINMQILRNFEIPLPSLEEQKAIARKLDKVSGLIEKRKTQLEKLSELVKSRFIEMFGGVHDSKIYPYKAVKELTDVVSGGTPSRDISEYWEEGTIPWVKTTELQNNIVTEVEEYITEQGLSNSSAKIVPSGTVLIAMYGQGKTRGMTAYLGIEACTNQACACILPSAKINQTFLWQFFILSYDNLRDMAKGGNQPNLNGNMIKNYPILCPPRELQEQFAAFVEQVDKSKFEIQQSLEKLEILKKSLMQQYFG